MAMQNRMVLDWMLAKEGGVCAKFGSYCCTFIPNNTAPTGNFTLAMNKLLRLCHELAENSGPDGFNSVLSEWFRRVFGSTWGTWLASVLDVIGLILLILYLVVCCCEKVNFLPSHWSKKRAFGPLRH